MIDDKSNDEPPKEEVERTGSYFETQFITTNNGGDHQWREGEMRSEAVSRLFCCSCYRDVLILLEKLLE